ncbi:hypothetical protein G6F54_011794 [Rhizopus delemar]|nr:hypothetical protein G6F54_011794 [Rhizopus delemar]
MANNFNQLIRKHYNSTRLQNSIPHTSTNNNNTISYPTFWRRADTIDRSSYSRSTVQAGNRARLRCGSSHDTRLLQLDVCHPQEGWRHSTGFQPQTPEPISGRSSFQDGNYQGSSTNDQSKRLLGLNRFVRCISTHRSSSRIEEILTAQMERSSLPVLYDRLWFVYQSICLQQSLQTHTRTLSLSRLSDFGLFRRLDFSCKYKTIGYTTGTDSGESTPTTRLVNQLQEIGLDSNSATETPRLCIEYQNHDGFSADEEVEGSSQIYQTNIGPSTETNPSSHSQCYHEDSSNHLRHISGTPVHSSFVIPQESNGTYGQGLGSPSVVRSRESTGATVVVQQPQALEWPLISAYNSIGNCVCRCQQHRLGMQLEESSNSWILDTRRGSTVHQLERTQGSISGFTDISNSQEYNGSNTNRQYNQYDIHQQTRWHSFSSSYDVSDSSMDMVLEEQHYATSPIHSRHSQQSGRFRVASPILQEPMDDQTSNFSTNQSDVGPVLCGPICRPNDQIVTKVRLVDSGSSRYPYGCVYHPVEEVSASIHQPSMEFDYSGSSQNHSRTASSGDSSGAILAQRDMVSPGTTSGSDGSLAATSTIVRQNLNAQAVEDLLAQRLVNNGTNRLYRKNQLRFLAWATQHNVSCTAFTPSELVNFLADMRQEHNLQASTLKTLRTAVAHLHDLSTSISEDTLINSYLDTIAKQAPPVSIHRPTIDVSPALSYARTIASRTSTTVKLLQQKLVFLLAMAAFLRPSDLARIPFASCSILDSGRTERNSW